MTDAIDVRRLDASDLSVIEESDVFDNDVVPAEARAFLDDANHEIVGALQDGRLIGFASGVVLLHPDKAPTLLVSEVGVDEAFQRRGVGARLTSALLEIARARGCKGVWLATEADNAPARALYRKLGARETDGIVVYDWDGAMDDHGR